MADTAWYNLLPSAPNIATGTQAAQQASAQAQGASTAAADASYSLDLKKTVEALAAASMGPNGVDQDKFYQLASGTPYGVSAIKAYADTIFPQMQKQTVAGGGAKILDENGSVGGQQVAAAMQENPNFSTDILGTAMNVQKAQFGNAADIAKARTTVQAVSPGAWASQPTTAPTGAQPGSIGGNTGMQVQAPTVGTGNYKGDFSVDQYAKMSPQDQAALRRGLIGVSDELDNPVNEKSSPASIASAARKLQATQFTAGLPGVDVNDIGSTIEKTGAANNAGPAVGLKAVQDAIARGYSLKGTNLSQTGAGFSNLAAAQGQDPVQEFRAAGFNANPSNIAQLQQAKASYDWLDNTSNEIKQVTAQVAKSPLDPDQFAAKVNAFSNAPMVAESISNLAGQKRFFENMRIDPSLGALVKESDGNPLHFLQSLGSVKLGAQSQQKVLEVLGNIVDTQLQTGQAKSTLDQFRAHWSKQPAGKTKADPLGIR